MRDAVDVGHHRLLRDGQGPGHGVVVVVQPLLAEAGVLVERPVAADPVEGGADADVVWREARVEHALEAGVGHRPVAAEAAGRPHDDLLTPAALAGGFARHRLSPVGRRVDEAAVVARPFGLVGGLEVLGPRDEGEGPLTGRLIGAHPGVVERIEQHLRVGEIGPAAVAVAGAAEPVLPGREPLALIPLLDHKPLAALLQVVAQVVGLDAGQGAHDRGGHVVGEVAAVERAVLAPGGEHVPQGPAQAFVAGGVRVGLDEGLDRERRHRHRDRRRSIRIVGGRNPHTAEPFAAGSLGRAQIAHPLVDRPPRLLPVCPADRHLLGLAGDAEGRRHGQHDLFG